MSSDDAAEPEIAGLMHGGRLQQARREFVGAPEPFIDLSTGINPWAYRVPELPITCFARLPEPEAVQALELAAAARYGVANAAMVIAAPGTQILIDLLPRLLPSRRVSVLEPTYAEHAASWRRVGCDVTGVDSLASLGEADIVVVCNPNNPDGRRFPPSDLLRLADRLAERNGTLVVDEAFADLEGDGISLAGCLPHPALVLLRSFGKSYGLAGLRLGFALASPDRAAQIRVALGPWAVSGPAIAIGCQALADTAWLASAAQRAAEAAARLDALLIAAGLRVVGGTRLFRLAEADDATAIHRRLGAAGVLVRQFAEHRQWLRFGLPPDAASWERLRVALSG